MGYLTLAIEIDRTAITQEKVDSLQAQIPGLVIQQGHVLYFLLDATSERDSINAQLIADVGDLIWDTFGDKILRLPRLLATRASGQSTWTRVDSTDFPLASPLTIPAGTGLSLLAADNTRVAFTTIGDVTFAAGAASTAVGEVEILAVSGGTESTGLQVDPQPDETLIWLDTITVTAPTAGGADDEDLDTYRSRLGDEASLMARTLVRPEDFATRARGITGVDLALALDLYNATTSTAGVAGHMTVAVRDEDGADPGATVRANVLAALNADSISILTNHVIAPTYTTITVVFAGVAYASYDPADVEARAEQAVLEFLSPGNWGLPPFPLFGNDRVWLDKPIVRYRDIIAVIENTEGLDYTAAAAGTATTTSGSPNLTLVTPTTRWKNGMAVTGAGIPAGTKIVSGAGTATMVMSANATASAAGVAITGAAVTLNGGTADVTMTGPAALPSLSSTADGTVTAT